MALRGTFRILVLYDVADFINLARVNSILQVRPAERLPSFTHHTPEYVRFELPPVVEPLEPIELETGERLDALIKYYDHGVTSLEINLIFCSRASVRGSGHTLPCMGISIPGARRHRRMVQQQAVGARLRW